MAQRAEIRTPLPQTGRVHRVGKIRAGIKKAGSKDGKAIEYPSAVDYFVVNADASTGAESAASFKRVYGEQPRELRVTLPGAQPEDVLESVYRYYGGSVLKRKCEGPGGQCKERDGSGEWVYGPCACDRLKIPVDDKRNHCQPRWTFTFLLMDVIGVGVWQFDTGSPMAGDGMAAMLFLMQTFRGSLLRAECTLRLAPVQVAPKGQAKTVYIARLEASGMTPTEAMALAGDQTPLGILPPSTLDDGPDDLLDPDAVEEIIEATALPAAAASEHSPTVVSLPVSAQLKDLSLTQRADLYRLAGIAKGSTAVVVRGLLCACWDTLGLPPFDEEPDVLTLLAGLQMRAIKQTQEDGGAEAFQHFADTGQIVEPGDQTSMYGDGAPS